MHDVIIFLGPSLPVHEAEKILTAEFLPPVRRVDLIRIIQEKPRIIGIIDGVFFEDAAVGHREVLEVIKAGITVIGASSMGALRAAELEPFGMIGIGGVFKMYRDGIIESDDEVALMCDPNTHTAFSEALVNVRVTMLHGVSSGFLTPEEAGSIITAGKKLWYPDRSWTRILHDGIIDNTRREEIRTWLLNNTIDQKREDAISALEYIKGIRA